MTAQVVAALAVPALIEALKTGLQQMDHPAAKGAVDAIGTLQDSVMNGGISAENMAAANAHIEKMAEISGARDAVALTQINESLRAEVASSDPYVRRMRPTFGYMMSITWGAQMLALAYIIVTDPARAGDVLNAMESLATIWAVALSVMGIYVYQRSVEKRGGGHVPSVLPASWAQKTPGPDTGTPHQAQRKYN